MTRDCAQIGIYGNRRSSRLTLLLLRAAFCVTMILASGLSLEAQEAGALAKLERRPATPRARKIVEEVLSPIRLLRSQSDTPATADDSLLQRRRTALYSVMDIQSMRPPSESESSLPELEGHTPPPPKLPKWQDAFEDWVQQNEVDQECYMHPDLLSGVAPRWSPQENMLWDIANQVALRHARKLARSDLRDQREEDLTMDPLDYQRRREQIRWWGREDRQTRSTSLILSELLSAQSEDTEDESGDEDIPLIEWGPIIVDDSGSLRVDVQKLVSNPGSPETKLSLSAGDPGLEELDSIPTESEDELRLVNKSRYKPPKFYRWDTDLRFTPHFSELPEGNLRAFLGKLKGSVEVDFYNRTTGERTWAMELEGQHRPNGDHAVFFNIIVFAK